MPPRDPFEFYPYMNPDAPSPGDRPPTSPTGAIPSGIRTGEAQPAGSIGFDKIIRRSYLAPPTAGVSLALFTVGQDFTGGLITRFGIGSPQFDWFGTNEYFLAVNDAPPMEQQFEIAGGPGPAGSFFGGVPIGTLQDPKPIKVPLITNSIVTLRIAPQTTPAAGTVVYNIWTRLVGYLYR